MTFDPDETVNGSKYQFLGVNYNHDTKQYNLSDRFISNLPQTFPGRIPFYQLESGVARLVYASSVLKIYLPQFYRCIKYTRRQISRINKGIINDNTLLDLSPCVLDQLNRWLAKIRTNELKRYEPVPNGQPAVLYTDASLKGWGAVLILPTGPVHATGAPWNAPMEINAGETLAVQHALTAFEDRWTQFRKIQLRVDNTSVEAALRKRWSDSQQLSATLERILPYAEGRGLHITPSYVNTKENMADSYSREFSAN